MEEVASIPKRLYLGRVEWAPRVLIHWVQLWTTVPSTLVCAIPG